MWFQDNPGLCLRRRHCICQHFIVRLEDQGVKPSCDSFFLYCRPIMGGQPPLVCGASQSSLTSRDFCPSFTFEPSRPVCVLFRSFLLPKVFLWILLLTDSGTWGKEVDDVPSLSYRSHWTHCTSLPTFSVGAKSTYLEPRVYDSPETLSHCSRESYYGGVRRP